MRSWLFVPGDSDKKLDKAAGAGSDVIIADLEDSVSPDRKAAARRIVLDALTDPSFRRSSRVHVRINALDTGLSETDLDAIVAGAPDGIMLPKSNNGADVACLDSRLRVAEAEAGILDGSIAISAIVTETAASLFGLGSYAGSSRRLCAMAWGAEDLSAALGAESKRDDRGRYGDPYRLARTLTLAGAVAADAAPIDTVFTELGNLDGLKTECEAARRDGFVGKLAIHPAQIPVINAAFTPAPGAVAAARRIMAAFAANPDAGALSIDGKMIDRPHLLQAQRIVARAE